MTQNAKVSLIGISNDLKFTDFLDPRVKSRWARRRWSSRHTTPTS